MCCRLWRQVEGQQKTGNSHATSRSACSIAVAARAGSLSNQGLRRHPGAAGDREDPHASGPAGQRTAACACPWVAAERGPTRPTHRPSVGPAPTAAGIAFGCASLDRGQGARSCGSTRTPALRCERSAAASALGRPPSTTKIVIRASTDEPADLVTKGIGPWNGLSPLRPRRARPVRQARNRPQGLFHARAHPMWKKQSLLPSRSRK